MIAGTLVVTDPAGQGSVTITFAYGGGQDTFQAFGAIPGITFKPPAIQEEKSTLSGSVLFSSA